MLFAIPVGKKFKEKHPGITTREVAVRTGGWVNLERGVANCNHTSIGSKWRSLPAEKQQKYRDEYAGLREDYERKTAHFYEEHPEAKPLQAIRWVGR